MLHGRSGHRRRDRFVICAVAGLGDRLVGGEVDGETYALDAATGATLDAPQEERVLRDVDLAGLHDFARRVAAARDGPQDIEWAFEGDRLYLLQARAITTVPRAPRTRMRRARSSTTPTSSKAILVSSAN